MTRIKKNRKSFVSDKVLVKKNTKLFDLIKHNEPDDLDVSFTHYDGSKRTLAINNTFFYDERQKRLKPHQIIKKLNTLKHDFKAYKFELVKL